MLEEIYIELDKFENYITKNPIHQQNELDYYLNKIKNIIEDLEFQGVNINKFNLRLKNLSARVANANKAEETNQTEQHHNTHTGNLQSK
jgi:hypothetical protein